MTREEFAIFLKKLKTANDNGQDIDAIVKENERRNVYFYNDGCIKKILASEKNLTLTTDLINAALNLVGSDRIENPQLVNPFIPGELGYRSVEPDLLWINDRGNGDALREGVWHLLSRYSTIKAAETDGSAVSWEYTHPMVPDFLARLTMEARADGLHVSLKFKGVANQPDLPALGLSFQLDPRLSRVGYLGLGPDENYTDRREGAYLGHFSYGVNEGWTRYCKPQESGSRGGVRCLRVTDETGHGVEITGEGLEVSVQPYLPEELAACWHPDELGEPVRTVLDVAAFRKGIGGDDSWGAPVLPQYTYPSDRDYELRFVMKGV